MQAVFKNLNSRQLLCKVSLGNVKTHGVQEHFMASKGPYIQLIHLAHIQMVIIINHIIKIKMKLDKILYHFQTLIFAGAEFQKGTDLVGFVLKDNHHNLLKVLFHKGITFLFNCFGQNSAHFIQGLLDLLLVK